MKSFAPTSSRVTLITYEETKQELIIDFTRGGTYRYFEVPEDIYIVLVNAESVGKTINEVIKGKFGFLKI